MTLDWTTLELVRVHQMALDIAIVMGPSLVVGTPLAAAYARGSLLRAPFLASVFGLICFTAGLWVYSVFGPQGTIRRDQETLTFDGRWRFEVSVPLEGARVGLAPWFERGAIEVGGVFLQGPLLEITSGKERVLVAARDLDLAEDILGELPEHGTPAFPTYEVARNDFLLLVRLLEPRMGR